MSKRILVVEHDEATLEALGLAFRRAGLEPVSAPDAATALARFREATPSAVLISVGPDQETSTLVAELRKERDGAIIPVLFMGEAQVDDEVRSPSDALAVGGDYFFKLPTDLDYLAGRVLGWTGESTSTISARLDPEPLDLGPIPFAELTDEVTELTAPIPLPVAPRLPAPVPDAPVDDGPTAGLPDRVASTRRPTSTPRDREALEMVKEGERLRTSGHPDAAVEAYAAAAEVYEAAERIDPALALHKLIVHLDPTRMELAQHAADLARAHGKNKDAIEILRRPAKALEAAERFEDAAQVVRTLIELSPSDPALVLKLASLESKIREAARPISKPAHAPLPPLSAPGPEPDLRAPNHDDWDAALARELALSEEALLPPPPPAKLAVIPAESGAPEPWSPLELEPIEEAPPPPPLAFPDRTSPEGWEDDVASVEELSPDGALEIEPAPVPTPPLPRRRSSRERPRPSAKRSSEPPKKVATPSSPPTKDTSSPEGSALGRSAAAGLELEGDAPNVGQEPGPGPVVPSAESQPSSRQPERPPSNEASAADPGSRSAPAPIPRLGSEPGSFRDVALPFQSARASTDEPTRRAEATPASTTPTGGETAATAGQAQASTGDQAAPPPGREPPPRSPAPPPEDVPSSAPRTSGSPMSEEGATGDTSREGGPSNPERSTAPEASPAPLTSPPESRRSAGEPQESQGAAANSEKGVGTAQKPPTGATSERDGRPPRVAAGETSTSEARPGAQAPLARATIPTPAAADSASRGVSRDDTRPGPAADEHPQSPGTPALDATAPPTEAAPTSAPQSNVPDPSPVPVADPSRAQDPKARPLRPDLEAPAPVPAGGSKASARAPAPSLEALPVFGATPGGPPSVEVSTAPTSPLPGPAPLPGSITPPAVTTDAPTRPGSAAVAAALAGAGRPSSSPDDGVPHRPGPPAIEASPDGPASAGTPALLPLRPLLPAQGNLRSLSDVITLFAQLRAQRSTGLLHAEGLATYAIVHGEPAALRGEMALDTLLVLLEPRLLAATPIPGPNDRPVILGRDLVQRGKLRERECFAYLHHHLELGVLALLRHRGPFRFEAEGAALLREELVPEPTGAFELLVDLLPWVVPGPELLHGLGGPDARLRAAASPGHLTGRDLRFAALLDGQHRLEDAARLAMISLERAAALGTLLVGFGRATVVPAKVARPLGSSRPEPAWMPLGLGPPPAKTAPLPVPEVVHDSLPPAPVPHAPLQSLEPKARLTALAELVRTSDYFTILGVDHAASKSAIDQAHHRLRSLVAGPEHQEDPESRKLSAEVLRSLDEARDVLKIPELRTAYLRHLKP